ncbi:LuxR C-terminal-related transcriptional regulator [Enterobacter quasiroggenkampii]|uniref:helix-turn-helix transcriptional regulator n=1 Tax=Enterobacter quasiroggenkampii TaxID=2497436 RepID=UPI0021CFCD21|nr:LuxR C-terminal-related transcriptional regulator [Enterobacter quasiroggenkampii]MCU6398758.1 LuxR C-terminal-related transcriptional regulator [Enterobacter quasiroggenkampii]
MNTHVKESRPKVLLYEPRYLLHNAASHLFEELGWNVFDIRADMFIEDCCSIADKTTLIALDINGAGKNIIPFLRAIHRLSSMNYKIIVWLPKKDSTFSILLNSLGVRHIFKESTLHEEIATFSARHFPPGNDQEQPKQRKKLSNSELDILIDISKGMSVASIANVRHCSRKTVYSLKRNILTRLEITNHEWIVMLSRILKIQSIVS